MKKPIKPRKPSKLAVVKKVFPKPQKRIKGYEIELSTWQTNLQDAIDAAVKAKNIEFLSKLEFKDIQIRTGWDDTTIYLRCDHTYDNTMYELECARFEQDKAAHDKKYGKYLKKLEQYKVKMVQYEEDMAIFEKELKKYEKYRKSAATEKRRKQFEELFKEFAK